MTTIITIALTMFFMALADSLAGLIYAWADRIRYKTERLRFELHNVQEINRLTEEESNGQKENI